MYAVRRSEPPKQMFVVNGSGTETNRGGCTGRGEDRNAAVDQRGDADVTGGVYRQRVVHVKAADPL